MTKIFNAHVQCVGGSAIPQTMAIASQTGVKGYVSETSKETFIKLWESM